MGLPRRASHGGLRPRLDSRQDVATLALALLASLALAASGCAPAAVSTAPPKSGAAPAASAKPRPRPGYDRRTDALASVDTSSLRGRRIVLDPGHGGFFRGALGVHGLTEAEVNLGVALALRGLLEARGAEVLMTRTDDRDFLTPTDSTLRSDLAERYASRTRSRPICSCRSTTTPMRAARTTSTRRRPTTSSVTKGRRSMRRRACTASWCETSASTRIA
jgi:N-acetylmuramoyl-L-alanine amidase